MDKETIRKVNEALEGILPSDEIDKFNDELSKEMKKKDRILLAKEIADGLKPLLLRAKFSKFVESEVRTVEVNIHGTIIAEENTGRKGLYIFNASEFPLYIKLGNGISKTSFTILLEKGAYYELGQPIYTGIVEGMGENGQALITELF